MDTFGLPKENKSKPNEETAGMKNNPRNIQQHNLEEEESSLTIVDLPISERLLDSNRDDHERREESRANYNKKHVG